MADYEIFKEFDIQINVQQVLTYMECPESNPMYEGLKQECMALEERLKILVQPEAVCVFDTFTDPEDGNQEAAAVYVLFHIGNAISEAIDEAFRADRYMEGMLLDAMADDYLFQVGAQTQQRLYDICRQRGCGIRSRLEAPADIPAAAHKEILRQVKAVTETVVELTDGYMFRPVKTLAYVLLLTSDTEASVPFHDCARCEKTDCRQRQYPAQLEVLWQGKTVYIPLDDGKEPESIYQLLTTHGFPLAGACGGNGCCGKCRIRLDYGELAVTAEDRQVFSPDELAAGWRLACRAYPDPQQRTCTIELEYSPDEIQAVAAVPEHGDIGAQLKIAIDIGTTTLAFALLDEAGQVVGTHVQMNHQKAYGADVIARQMAATGGQAEVLQQLITDDLTEGIGYLCRQHKVSPAAVDYIVVSGNTTMIHLLMGYSCEGLGKYPYRAVNLERIETTLREPGSGEADIPVMILPGISAYAGGDIAAGLLACGFEAQDKPVLLLDIGTNGEMAVGNRERIVVASAAAGPAFEGGNISCGMASVSGAVSSIRIAGEQVLTEVIGGGTPAGICGTGVMTGVAELYRTGIIGADGLMQEPYFTDGFCFGRDAGGNKLVLTQRDIREFQMAKGAIRAGADVLLQTYGIAYEELEAVYLAGGFGVYMDIRAAVQIGLLPESVQDKIIVKGNTALEGARISACDPGAITRISRLIRVTEEIHLSETEHFQELYMKHMYLNERIE